MSVLKNKRKTSYLEYRYNAIQIRKSISLLVLRNFGIKDKVRDIKISSFEPLNEQDQNTLQELSDRYNLRILLEYPMWMIDRLRTHILDIAASLCENITIADNIHPKYDWERKEKRKYQDLAICDCERLLQEFQYIISIIPIDAEKLMRYVDMIEKEKLLLKGWRKRKV